MSGDFLQQMAQSSRERVVAAMKQRSAAELTALAAAMPAAPALQLDPAGFDLIAELKLRSPAVGQLKAADEDVVARVTDYAKAGAAAVSVLTEPSRFDGSMHHLEKATRVLAPLRVPAMRKDFLVDPYQVLEARAAGAGGVLVILRMLSRDELEALIDAALRLGLFVLLEAFDEQDIALAHDLVNAHTQHELFSIPNSDVCPGSSLQPELLVGVNCRDLVTLQVVPERLLQLAPLLPTTVPRVAESGVGSAEDARRVAEAGYDLALVGSALMKGQDPGMLVREMLRAAREARRSGAAASGSLSAARGR